MDRFLGVLCALVLVVSTIIGFTTWSGWLLLWSLGLGIWVLAGLKEIEVGWRGLLTVIGQRQSHEFGEGWHWAPFPSGILPADCREQIMSLENLEAITRDDVRVNIGGTVVYRIAEGGLFTFFGVSNLKRGIEDTRAEVIRARVRQLPLEAESGVMGVLDSHEELGREFGTALGAASVGWGIVILRVIIPEIASSDPKVSEDLALKKREELQQVGQVVELHHTDRMVSAMEHGGNVTVGGRNFTFTGGLTKEEAVTQVRLALGQMKLQGLTLDASSATALAALLSGRGRL